MLPNPKAMRQRPDETTVILSEASDWLETLCRLLSSGSPLSICLHPWLGTVLRRWHWLASAESIACLCYHAPRRVARTFLKSSQVVQADGTCLVASERSEAALDYLGQGRRDPSLRRG